MGRRGKKKSKEDKDEPKGEQLDRSRSDRSHGGDDRGRHNSSWNDSQRRDDRRDYHMNRSHDRGSRGHSRGGGPRGRGRGAPRGHPRFNSRADSFSPHPRNHGRDYNYQPNDGVRTLHFEENPIPSTPPTSFVHFKVNEVQQPIIGREEPKEPEPKEPEPPKVPEKEVPKEASPKKKAPEAVAPPAPIKNIKMEKRESESSSDTSSDDEEEEDPKKVTKTPTKIIKKEPVEKKLPAPTSSESSSEFESDSEDEQEKKSEEDIVCLGNLENFEDLVSDDNSKEKRNKKQELKICQLCDKKGHISFNCMMVCKNCGEQYHNLKGCPKPPNLSIMLQYFLEFCMSQCSQYNPEQRFQFNNGLIQGQMLPGCNPTDVDSNSHRKGKKRQSKKAETTSESDSDSSRATSSTKRKRKKMKTESVEKMPFGPFAPQFTNGNFNPMNMMALGQMMGFNPMVYAKK